MTFIPLPNKYRPRTFDEIVGQSATSTILKRSVILDRIANVYLFHGVRGTGKTSTARIFAKALSCKNVKEGNPCNACEFCKLIDKSIFPDVIELDAGSNSGIDKIKSLIEESLFGSKYGKYKIYIIDEAHGLSKQAWNALLKTLEEPTYNSKFILCTTEYHKLLKTIVSRSLSFSFKRLSIGILFEHIKKISSKEGMGIADKIIKEVVANADGSVRDALNLLEQVLLVKEDEAAVEKILVRVSDNDLKLFLSYLIDDKFKDARNFVQNLAIPIDGFLTRLIRYMYNIYPVNVDTNLYADYGIGEDVWIECLSLIVGWKQDLQKSMDFSLLSELCLLEIMRYISLQRTDISDSIQSHVKVITNKLKGTYEEWGKGVFLITSKKGKELFVVKDEKVVSNGLYCIYPSDTNIIIKSKLSPMELYRDGIIKRAVE